MKKYALLLLCAFLASCAPSKWVNYDSSKSTQQNYDLDSANCELAADQQYGDWAHTPLNFVDLCLTSKGWKKVK